MTRTDHITVRVEPETRQALERLAAQEHRTLSNMVRVLLLEALAARHEAPADEAQ